MEQKALLVFAHGARNPAWAEPLQRICAVLRAQRPELRVELAFLELMQPLISDALDQLVSAGVRDITIIPVFMAAGGHLRNDLPQLVAAAQARHQGLRVHVGSAIGESERVIAAIADFALETLDQHGA